MGPTAAGENVIAEGHPGKVVLRSVSVHRRRGDGEPGGQGVVSLASREHIVAIPAGDGVVATAAGQHVRVGIPADVDGHGGAGSVDVIEPVHHGRVARGLVRVVHVERDGAGHDESVDARAADNRHIVAVVGHGVITGTAVEGVRARAAVEGVVSVEAVDGRLAGASAVVQRFISRGTE